MGNLSKNELRIGNLIFQSGQITTIENISRSINDWERVNNKRLFDCAPIPITEEWLLRFGFTKHSTNPFWFRKKQICISLVGAIELISWDMQVFKIDSKAEYIHELQNLYFALTGEELTLKP